MVELVYELTCDAEELAIDSLRLYVYKLVLEECNVKGEDMRKCLQVRRGWVELEYMKIWKEGVETTIVIDVYTLEGIHIYAGVFEDLTVILAGDVIHDFLLVETSSQQGMIEEEQISDDLLVYY